jgi:hypothetical protein
MVVVDWKSKTFEDAELAGELYIVQRVPDLVKKVILSVGMKVINY